MSEACQRWRLAFSRGEEARYLSHLDAVTLWERALRRGGIPVATTGGFTPRPRLVFAAPLQLGMLAEHDLADLYLSERLTAPALRARLTAGIPAGYHVLDLHDVWTGAPAIAPQLAAADYRLTLIGASRAAVAGAIGRLLAKAELPRVLKRENRQRSYDLRPLLLELRATEPDPAATAAVTGRGTAAGGIGRETAGLWMRLRHSQDEGSGRPDQVVSAIGDELGLAPAAGLAVDDADAGGAGPTAASSAGPGLEIVLPVRERLWLAEDLEAATAPAQSNGPGRAPTPSAGQDED